MTSTVAFAAIFAQPVPAPAPGAPAAATPPAGPPRLQAARASGPIHLDGRLDEPAWQAAPASGAFTQRYPDEGQPPTERTAVRVLYDDQAIYVGIDCQQVRSRVIHRLTRRDRFVEADWVMVDLGTRGDHVSSFYFQVNAAGVLQDGIRFNDSDSSQDWDDNWDARTARTATGWSVEFEIPIHILRFAALAEQTWDFQVHRGISERQEIDQWSFVPRGVGGVVSHFGRLEGLRGLRPRNSVELRPFGLLRLRHRDPTPDLADAGWDLRPSAGLDAKWHVSQDLTLDVTANPDFGQVEADQVVLNLTTFETFFPEKRPFFIEGIDTFRTPMGLLYTRRIGRAPGPPELPAGEQLADLPEPSRIWGAAKLVGNLGARTSLGALAAVTGTNRVTARRTDGSRVEHLADPASAFNVLRLRREVGGNSHVGLLATATNRLEATDAYNDAYAGGVDGRWRSPSGDWIVAAQVVGSRLENGPQRPQPDGLPIHPGTTSPGGYLAVAKEGGKHVVFDWTTRLDGKFLDINDLGYLQRKNDFTTRLDLAWRSFEPWGPTLERRTQVELGYGTTLDGIKLSNIYQVNESWRFRNHWRVFTELHYRASRFDDRETGDGTALERAGLAGWEIEVTSDPRRAVSLELGSTVQRLGNGWNASGGATLSFRLHPQLDLDLAPEASWTHGEPRFVGGGGASLSDYLFGRLEARSLGATLRATFTFTPRLTLQTYAQAFLASGRYDDFQHADTGGGFRSKVRLSDLAPAAPPAESPDFEEAALNLNVLLRWEYRLGSVLYLVYTRAQAPDIALGPGETPALDLGRLRGAPAVDAFLLKLSYWWG